VPGPAAGDRRLGIVQDRLRAGEVDHGAGPGALRAPPAPRSSRPNGPGGRSGPGTPVRSGGSIGSGRAFGAGGTVGSARGRRRGSASAGRNPAVRGPVRPGRPDPGTPGPHAEVEGSRYADQSRDGESRDQDHGLHPECRAWWGYRGACQAHAANDASLPSLSRAPWSPLDQHRFWLTTGDRVTRLKNFRLKLITTCIRMITGSRSALFVRVRLWRSRSPSIPPAGAHHLAA
jgi:hypothetical protein